MTDDVPLDPVKYRAWLEQSIDTDAAAAFLGMEAGELHRRRVDGGGPEFQKFGHRTVRYTRRDLIAFRDSVKFKKTAEYKPATQEAEVALESIDATGEPTS